METQEIIKKIFSRQFKRCENDLKQVNIPQVFLDCVSKYFNFTEKDVLDYVINKEKGESNETNYNKK